MKTLKNFTPANIQNFQYETIDYKNRCFNVWFQIDDDVYLNIEDSEVFLSDCNNENRQELSKEEALWWLEYAKDLFEDRYSEEIEEAEIEFQEWLLQD